MNERLRCKAQVANAAWQGYRVVLVAGQILYISTILFLLISCNNKPKEKVTENNGISTEIKAVDFDSDFNKWLANQGLEKTPSGRSVR